MPNSPKSTTETGTRATPRPRATSTPGERARASRELRKALQEQKSKDRAASKKAKAEIFKFENRNRSKIAIFKSTGTWWKMGGRSALFYHYVISKRLKIKTNLREDTDAYNNFRDGIVSVKNVDQFRERLASINIRECAKGKNWLVFDIGTSFSDEEIAYYENLNKAKQQQFNKIIKLEFSDPRLFNCLLTIAKTTFDNVRKLDASKRELTGNNFYRMTEKMLLTYFELSKGSISKKAGKQVLENLCGKALNKLKIMQEYRLFDLDICIKIGKELALAEELIQQIDNE